MAVITMDKNPEALTLTLVAEFDAGVDRVWQLWEDPRQLERWWGPPTWPATFHKLEFVPGGRANYYMTGPEGEKAHGWWEFTAIDAPRTLQFDDGFADDDGNPTGDLGVTHATVTLEPLGERTRMTIQSSFESEEQLEQMVAMGMEEGLKGAVGQIDGILAEHAHA
ncbi:SRPBCC domain-containing protein [Arthrobacter sp. NicSoilB11]|uniref:SRPBCC family protein n=1 Tax=Arthrobacter sp. NicSoilB11 TaxID=2830999 RepID=UPI001CC34F97|nr:SRPBCC domain-containing protein [Arthrobacter sp. NicSoilB11]BCW77138.1 activator of HSP90 ATPase [Arthrobacter sp. NicSoilB11]